MRSEARRAARSGAEKKHAGGDVASRVVAGWAYNPSAWRERLPEAALALVAIGIGLYLGGYQVHLWDTVWDPFFGHGTAAVLESDLSHLFPVPDALLGAGGYLVDLVLVLAGGRERHRTAPWVVLLYGLATLSVAGSGITLTVSQGAIVGRWCFLCLCTTAISLVLLYLSWDEIWLAASIVWARWSAGVPLGRAVRTGAR